MLNINTDGSKLILVDIENEMKKSYLDYSMSVIVGRALPDVRDGLKPVHRRILYTLHENGLGPDKAYRKCADTVGSVLGRYHPHGDSSVYDALVRMAQNFSLRYPLIDGHGNFGSIDGDPAAAYRYTESRMSRISTLLLTDIDKETVDFIPNYDDRLQEPSVLPSRFPNLLVNGSTGIAVGMATNIPPHNLKEIINGVCAIIDNPDANLEEIMEHIHGPDFPTGGIIMGRSGIRSAYATGRGKIILRAKTEIEELPNGKSRILIHELPYMVNKSRLIEHIADLVKDKRIEQISNIMDQSDRNGMCIVIDLKRDANAQVVLNQLFSYSQLQDTVGVILLALVNGVPKIMDLKEILQHYITFQEEIVVRTTYDLKKAKERAHILEGFKIAQDNIDEVVAILKKAKSIPEGREKLIEIFNLSEIQANSIVQMRLGQITGLERTKIEEELVSLMEKILLMEGILMDRNKILAIIKEEITELKEKYKDERRTDIQMVSGEVDIEDLIPVEECVITLTHFGYIKRQPVDIYKSQKRGGRGISGMSTREEDFVEELFICSTHDYVMFFTNKGRCYRLKGYEIAESS
ncbi:MAG: DNA gyrase subunit A, partial [Oscillospiraceae bacterium]